MTKTKRIVGLAIGAAVGAFTLLHAGAGAADLYRTEIGACYRAAIETCLGEPEGQACINTGVDGCDRDHAVSAAQLSMTDRMELRAVTLNRIVPAPAPTAAVLETVSVTN